MRYFQNLAKKQKTEGQKNKVRGVLKTFIIDLLSPVEFFPKNIGILGEK